MVYHPVKFGYFSWSIAKKVYLLVLTVLTSLNLGWIKRAGDNLEGVLTQCINGNNLIELKKGTESELRSMIRNVIAKINIRLGKLHILGVLSTNFQEAL